MKEAEKRSLRRGAAIQIAASLAGLGVSPEHIPLQAVNIATALMVQLAEHERLEYEESERVLREGRQASEAKAADAKAGVETVDPH